MKVVGICGSPRNGNTEWMLRKLLGTIARLGVDTDLILLREKEIKACDGCLTCEAGGKQRKGICRIHDDMQKIYPELVEADGLAFGTPRSTLRCFPGYSRTSWTGPALSGQGCRESRLSASPWQKRALERQSRT